MRACRLDLQSYSDLSAFCPLDDESTLAGVFVLELLLGLDRAVGSVGVGVGSLTRIRMWS